MVAPAHSDETANRPLAPYESNVKKRKQLKPRSAGYALRSDKCKTADFCEFADARHFGPIRTFLSEDNRRPSEHELKLSLWKHFRRMFQLNQKLGESSTLSVAYLKTSDGRKYGQIYDAQNTISMYEVNNIERATARKGDRKSAASSSKKVAKGISCERSTSQKTKDLIHPSSKNDQLARRSNEVGDIQDPPTKSLAGRLAGRHAVASEQQGSKMTVPYIDTPSIPSSPIKVFLEEDVRPVRDCGQEPSTQQQFNHHRARQTPVRGSEDGLRARDSGNDGALELQRFRKGQRKSRDPEKKAIEQNTVAGTSRSCRGFPSFMQQGEELQVTVVENGNHGPGSPVPVSREIASSPSSSPIALAPETTIGNRIGMDHLRMGSMRNPPMPGPAPNSPLPSLPETHNSMAPGWPIASEHNHRIGNTERSPVEKGPSRIPLKKDGYSYLPSKRSPPKAKNKPAFAVRTNAATVLDEIAPPTSSAIQSKKHGMSVASEQVPKGTNVGDLDQWQRQRDPKSAARKVGDLACIASQMATAGSSNPAGSGATNVAGPEESVQTMSNFRDSQDSAISKLIASDNLRSLSSNKISYRLSPIIVVAEQEPTLPPFRNRSQKSQSNATSTDDQPKRYQTHSVHNASPRSTSLSLRILEKDHFKARPLSAHSMPNTRPVESLVLTPFAPSILRAQSTRSCHRASSVQHDPQISELEARFAAVEKKNMLLERAFLAVMDTSTKLGGIGCAGGKGGCDDARSPGDRLSNGSLSNGDSGNRSSGASEEGSLYTGLVNLLAYHSGEAEKRWSSGSEL